MLVIRDPSSLSQLNDHAVRELIRRRMDEYGDDAGLATFVAVEPGDPIDSLDAQLGFPILSNRFDGRRHGEPDFAPSFEVLEEHPGCYQMVFILADYGDGVLVFVPKHDGVDGRLSAHWLIPEPAPTPIPRDCLASPARGVPALYDCRRDSQAAARALAPRL